MQQLDRLQIDGSRSQPLKCLGTQPALILGGGAPAIEDKRDSVIDVGYLKITSKPNDY